MKIQIAGLVNDSIVDGPGLRFGVYVQGCSHKCPGCHNPQSHDFNDGRAMDTQEIWKIIKANPLLDGVTFSGGEPFEQPLPLIELGQKAKEWDLNIWCYTGYTVEELLKGDQDKKSLLSLVDVLVDGPFLAEEKSLELKFKGSKNQRILDVPKTLATGKAIEFPL